MSLTGMLASPRCIIFLLFLIAFIIWLIVKKNENEYSKRYHCVDAIVPAYNEELTISRTVSDLAANKYIKSIIVINDGSTDRTGEVLLNLKLLLHDKLIIVSQSNTGKAGAINNGLQYVRSEMVFLTDCGYKNSQRFRLGIPDKIN